MWFPWIIQPNDPCLIGGGSGNFQPSFRGGSVSFVPKGGGGPCVFYPQHFQMLRPTPPYTIFFRLSFGNCLSCVVTARIFLLFDLSSAVQIYVSYIIYIHLFILHGYITNSQYDQLPVGLIAQLVEHCTGIAEVMGSNTVQA